MGAFKGFFPLFPARSVAAGGTLAGTARVRLGSRWPLESGFAPWERGGCFLWPYEGAVVAAFFWVGCYRMHLVRPKARWLHSAVETVQKQQRKVAELCQLWTFCPVVHVDPVVASYFPYNENFDA